MVTNIVFALAALSGVRLVNQTGYLDHGTTDIVPTAGFVCKYGAVGEMTHYGLYRLAWADVRRTRT